jgi:regulatory protein
LKRPNRAIVAGRGGSFAERRARRAAVDDPAVVLDAAARFLETRSRSVAEVRRRLTTAGYRADLIDGAVERLLELGVLDDAAFARAWVESRDRARPRAERALRQELALKGVDRATIDAAMEERTDSEHPSDADPDFEAALRLLAQNARTLGREADPRRRRQRAYVLLARHGFPPDIAAHASAQVVLDSAGDEVDVD